MNNFIAMKAVTMAATSLIIIGAISTMPVRAADEEDHTIRPGIGVGIAKLGMDEGQMKKACGNIDGSYTLPTGIKVDFAEWKEPAPKKSPNIRFFYDKKGKAIQINSAAPVPATTDGISYQSSMADVQAKYKHLQSTAYTTKDLHIVYCDDSRQGIAFEFTRPLAGSSLQLYAIIVHLPGKRVISDAGELVLSMKAK